MDLIAGAVPTAARLLGVGPLAVRTRSSTSVMSLSAAAIVPGLGQIHHQTLHSGPDPRADGLGAGPRPGR